MPAGPRPGPMCSVLCPSCLFEKVALSLVTCSGDSGHPGHSSLPLLVEVGVEGRGLTVPVLGSVALPSSACISTWLDADACDKGDTGAIDQEVPCTPEAERVPEGSDCLRAWLLPRDWGKVMVAPCKGLGRRVTQYFMHFMHGSTGATGEAWVPQAPTPR